MFDDVLPLLSYYKDIDPNGDAFRYWSDKDGKPHFETKEIEIVKIDIIAIQFEEITKIFDRIDWLKWYLTKEYNTGTFTQDLSRTQLEEISKLLPRPNEFAEKIKEVKEQIKKKYNIGSNKFDYALDIIRRHREFSAYMGVRRYFNVGMSDTVFLPFVASKTTHISRATRYHQQNNSFSLPYENEFEAVPFHKAVMQAPQPQKKEKRF